MAGKCKLTDNELDDIINYLLKSEEEINELASDYSDSDGKNIEVTQKIIKFKFPPHVFDV